MSQKSVQKVSLYVKIAVIANILLFGITGITYLFELNNFLGITLILAGFTNIIILLFNFSKKNIFFMSLNFAFAIISFVIFWDFITRNKFIGYIWLIITLYYLISGLYLLYLFNKEKKKTH